jgi:hypothetical protein
VGVSRRVFFALVLIGGPLLAYGILMLVTDGLRLVYSDNVPALLLIGIGAPTALAVSLGKKLRRTAKEIALASVVSVVLAFAAYVTAIIIWLLTLPPDFFN